MLKKILIANRGEIALRVIRACHELNIPSVAVHSTADSDSMHVKMANESVCIGPPKASESYLTIPNIIAACEIAGADSVHPGYGFLSENPAFAEILDDHKIVFIGPSSKHIRLMGDKITAKKTMTNLGVPCVPGSTGTVETVASAKEIAQELGYPVLIKASAGGGGRGMKLVMSSDELLQAFHAAKKESAAAFNNDAVYIEKYLLNPKHIEIQVFGDGLGNAVHLGERDCSIQRRHQKILEEAPSTVLTPKARQHIGEICANAIANLKYSGAGTIEFLYSNGKFYFIEMNTRIQVEHPITEQIFGVDLVKEQIRVASKEKLSFQQEKIHLKGHAIECRINAEKIPEFSASPGLITAYHAPGGHGVRVDSAIYAGYKVPPYYDSLICKLIVHGETRMDAILKLRRALKELIVDGIDTTAEIFDKILVSKEFERGTYDISWLEDFLIEQQRAK
ncbi:MAG: acetyl-CoA carboxylase biotin carboxylase subunit [Paracoccaceae bacterium]|nr:acetyl-CoA carboxylase biotin carboxylase subunit [Paracoccaceae bacterium]